MFVSLSFLCLFHFLSVSQLVSSASSQDNLVFINWVDDVNWPPERVSVADVSIVSPSSQ